MAGTGVKLHNQSWAKDAGDIVAETRAAIGSCDATAVAAADNKLEGLIKDARTAASGPGAFSVADAVLALVDRDKEDYDSLLQLSSQLRQEWGKAQPCDPPAGGVTVTGGAFTGQLDRRATGMLGTENGGIISPVNLVFLDNDDTVDGYFLNGTVDTTNLDNQLWGDFFQIDPDTRFSTGFNAVHIESNVDQQIGSIPTGADFGLIFSPVGIGGGLGGGLNVGNRDFENLIYANDYEFHQYSLKKQIAFNSGPVEFQPVGWVGYGGTEITERFSGQVAGINQNFAYHNMIDVDTFSIGAGLNVEFLIGEFGGVPVEYYGGVSFETQFHDQSGHSTLMLDGLVNAQETQNLGGSETTTAFEANAGFSFELTNTVDLVIGGRVRSFDTPSIDILPQQPARIEWHNATEAIVFAALKVGFGTRSPPADTSISDRTLPITAQTPIQTVPETPPYRQTTTRCGSNANIDFSQLSLQLDGKSRNRTGWGRAHLRYDGNPSVSTQFLNLVVNDATVAQNLPLRPGDKPGQQIDLMFWFNLGVPDGTHVDQVTYGCGVTPNRPVGAPDDDEQTAELKDEKIELWSDFWKETLTYQGPQTEKDRLWYPSTEFDVIDSAFHIWELIKNQECGSQECFPAAISNSFKMMLRSYPKKLQHLSDDPSKDNDATDIKTFKTGPWTGWEWSFVSDSGGSHTGRSDDPEAGFNRFKKKLESDPAYPFEAEIIDDPKDLDKVLEVIKKKGDCKLLGNAHAMLVTGVISLKNGDYLFEIADDSVQGDDTRGTDVRLVKYDASANEFSGYVLGGKSMTKGKGTVGGNVIFVCETVK